jgi:hypothetical protein
MNTQRSPVEQQRLYGAVRTILISYGLAAFVFLSSLPGSGDEPRLPGIAAPAQGLVVLGLGAQMLLIVVRLLIKRLISDRTSVIQAFIIIELIGDGVTVMLFALGTLGAIMHLADSV